MMHLRTLIALASGAVITSCASSPGDDLPRFGDSVRQTIQSQTYQDGDRVPGLRGDRAANSVEVYRNRGTKKDTSNGPMTSETASD